MDDETRRGAGTSDGFQMRYSANEHKMRLQEIERIRSQYRPQGETAEEERVGEDGLERLR